MRQIVSSSSVECKTQFFFFHFLAHKAVGQVCTSTCRVDLEDFGYELDANQIKSNQIIFQLLSLYLMLPTYLEIKKKKKRVPENSASFLINLVCVRLVAYHR